MNNPWYCLVALRFKQNICKSHKALFSFCLGQDMEQDRLISSLQELRLRGRSALEVYRSLPPAPKGEGDKAKSKNAKSGKKGKGSKGDKSGANDGGANPVKTLQGVAKKLGLGSLSAR